MGTIKEKVWIKPISFKCHTSLSLFSKEVPPSSACHETLLFLLFLKICCHYCLLPFIEQLTKLGYGTASFNINCMRQLFHFTDETVELQRGEGTCLRHHSW